MRAKLPTSEGKVDRQGIRIHYEVFGSGERTIIFIPTWSYVHSRIYKAQVPYFSENYRVVTFDPRGNGKSDRPDTPKGYMLDELVDDVAAVMDATETACAVVFGLSRSGLVGSVFAAYHPQRVEALISVAGQMPLVPLPEHRNVEAFLEDHESYEGWQKFNRQYWLTNYPDFCEFFASQIFCEPHSTKQIEDAVAWACEGDGEMLAMTGATAKKGAYTVDENMYRSIRCPVLLVHGDNDTIAPLAASQKAAELTGGELEIWPGTGHAPNARFPAKFNLQVQDFLNRHNLGPKPEPSGSSHGGTRRRTKQRSKKVLYLSSPIGLGHARRDLAVARELRSQHPDLTVDWLSQDPVTRFLNANGEKIHPASERLANESAHIEEESGEHDLNAFQALRNMDEILVANFMQFQEAVEQDTYDLIIADEAWEVDHFWHEHPELKRAPIAWLTDFVGWLPMPEGGEREAFLTADYNAEMIGHVERNPALRDRAIFVGSPNDIVPKSFGPDLPQMQDWIKERFEFSGYIIGEHPERFGPRAKLREQLGYRDDERVCIVTVGGSGVGGGLIRKIVAAYPLAREKTPDLRMIAVTGPRLDPAAFDFPDGVEARAFVPDLNRHLAACDLALVQGGLTTCMELAAAGTPFLYFPLKNHFEQNFHVAHRLDQYNAGRRMIFGDCSLEDIAHAMSEELTRPRMAKPVESDGARRAAQMLSALL